VVSFCFRDKQPLMDHVAEAVNHLGAVEVDA
jgi:hypothetical protein